MGNPVVTVSYHCWNVLVHSKHSETVWVPYYKSHSPELQAVSKKCPDRLNWCGETHLSVGGVFWHRPGWEGRGSTVVFGSRCAPSPSVPPPIGHRADISACSQFLHWQQNQSYRVSITDWGPEFSAIFCATLELLRDPGMWIKHPQGCVWASTVRDSTARLSAAQSFTVLTQADSIMFSYRNKYRDRWI